MKTFYLKKASNLSFFKKALLLKRLLKVLQHQAPFGIVIQYNNVKGYEVNQFLWSIEKDIPGLKSIALSTSFQKLLQPSGTSARFFCGGSSLLYTADATSFVNFNFRRFEKQFNYRVYGLSIKVHNLFLTLPFFRAKVLPALKTILTNKFFLFTCPVRIFLALPKQVLTVLKRQSYIS